MLSEANNLFVSLHWILFDVYALLRRGVGRKDSTAKVKYLAPSPFCVEFAMSQKAHSIGIVTIGQRETSQACILPLRTKIKLD